MERCSVPLVIGIVRTHGQCGFERETGKYYRVRYAPSGLNLFFFLAVLYKACLSMAWKMHRLPELEGRVGKRLDGAVAILCSAYTL